MKIIANQCILYSLTITVFVFYLISKIPIDYFLFDLLDHFQIYYFIAYLMVSITSLYIKDNFLALISFLFFLVSIFITFFPLLPYLSINYNISDNDKRINHPIKIMTANVYYKNKNYSGIQKMITEEEPDIVSIIELSPDQYDALNEYFSNNYPYKFTRPAPNPTGMGLFSKLPLENIVFLNPASDDFGIISSSIEINKKNYNLLAIHPFPPAPQDGFLRRNKVYAGLYNSLRNSSNETILIGDFNNTIWSDDFQKIVTSIKVQVDLSAPATWPAIFAFPKIGIDHILIPLSAHFLSTQRGPDIGSDHYAIISEFIL